MVFCPYGATCANPGTDEEANNIAAARTNRIVPLLCISLPLSYRCRGPLGPAPPVTTPQGPIPKCAKIGTPHQTLAIASDWIPKLPGLPASRRESAPASTFPDIPAHNLYGQNRR